MSENKPSEPQKDYSHKEIQDFKVKTLRALQNEPSEYDIDVLKPDMLPDNLKTRKVLKFKISPPTFYTLAKLAEVVEQLPPYIYDNKKLDSKSLKHIDKLVEMICILIHGSSKKKMPSWYKDFFMENLTTQECLLLWQETALKIDTSFFLPFIQTAKLMNPMSLISVSEKRRMNGLTPLD